MGITRRLLALLVFFFFFVGVSHAVERGREVSYTIQPGDNLSTIARLFSIRDYHDIARANKITDVHKIYAGQSLRIPDAFVAKKAQRPLPQALRQATPPSIEVGVASWYGKYHHGRKTASSETFDMHAMTVAHKTLPFGTKVHIENVLTGKAVVARVNDRGPFVNGRIVDVSYRVANILGIVKSGTATVRLSVLGQDRESHTARTTTSPRKDLESTREGNAVQLPVLAPIWLSEVVVTKFGPAHVIDGLNKNDIPKERAVELLFPEASAGIQGRLVKLIDDSPGEEIVLSVGDVLQKMLTAEGDVYKNVLQAQMSDAGLLATCYAFYDEGLARSYLVARETRSGNWYGEESAVTDRDTNPCINKRELNQGGDHTKNTKE